MFANFQGASRDQDSIEYEPAARFSRYEQGIRMGGPPVCQKDGTGAVCGTQLEAAVLPEMNIDLALVNFAVGNFNDGVRTIVAHRFLS